MASESSIAKLAAKPIKYQVTVLLGTMIALGGLYYQFYYSSLSEELDTTKSRYSRLEKKNKELKKRKKEWEQMVKDKETLDITLNTNQVSLPATSALASFIGHLQRQAAVAGVSFKNWSRLEEEAVTGYVKVPVSIEVLGSFHQVLKYFHLLNKTKRIITVEDFSLAPERTETDELLLKATFRATTFRQPDGAAPAPAPDETKPQGAVEAIKDGKKNKEDAVEAAADGKSGLDRLKNGAQ